MYPDKKEKHFASWSLYMYDIWSVYLRDWKKKDTYQPHLELEKLQARNRIT